MRGRWKKPEPKIPQNNSTAWLRKGGQDLFYNLKPVGHLGNCPSPWLAPMPKELGVRVFDMDETFSAEKGADRCNFPRKENAGSAERTAKTPSTLVEA